MPKRFLVCAILLAAFSCGRPGPAAPDSIDALEKVEIGGQDQWLLMRAENRNKPVLLVVHGGPGAASIGFARHFYSDLEREFIVVNWDQRGAGKSFSFFMPDVTPETYVSDTLEVILYLKKRFGRDKVYLMGHSWGAYIAAIAAHRNPEDLFAYIGVGPVVSGEQSAKISFEFIRTEASRDPALAAQAQNLDMESYLRDRRQWLNRFGAGMFHGAHSKDEDQFLRGIMYDSPDYSVLDMAAYLPGIWKTSSRLKGFFFQMDLFQQAPSIDVPVLLVSGRHDYYNPVTILERYKNSLKTPRKELVVFEDCAHAPHFESPQKFAALLKSLKESVENQRP